MKKSTQPGRPTRKQTRSGTAPERSHHIEFTLSRRTGAVIDVALAGLTKVQRQRVLAAIDRVGEEAGEKVGRWVEKNVVANANELLAFLTPAFAREGRWSDLSAIWAFLARLDVPVDHARLIALLERDGGGELAERYRHEAGR